MTRDIKVIKRFIHLAKGYKSSCHEQDHQTANALLDNIIAGEYSFDRDIVVETDVAIEILSEMIMYGVPMLSKATILLCSKYGQAMGLLIQNCKISLTEICIDTLMGFFISTLGLCTSSLAFEVLNGLLITLNAYNGSLSEETMEMAICLGSPLWSMLLERELEIHIQQACFNCIIAILSKIEEGKLENKFYVKISYQQTLSHLRILLRFMSPDDVTICKMTLNALRALQDILQLITEKDNIIEPDIIISLLKVFTVYGLPGFQSKLIHLKKNLPTAIEAPSYVPIDVSLTARKEKSSLSKKMVSSTKQKKKRQKNKSKKQGSATAGNDGDTVEDETSFTSQEQGLRMFQFSRSRTVYSSSESELSDIETEQSFGLICSKVRVAAVRNIQFVLHGIERKLRFSCWLLLVPESRSDIDPSILAFLENDPSSKVRIAAMGTLQELLNGSKLFLDNAITSSAENTTTSRPFVSFSTKMSMSVDLLHHVLMNNIVDQSQFRLTEKTIKCLTLVILNCPYDKIGSDWLKKFIPILASYLVSKDQNLIISTMTCLAAILSVKERTSSLGSLYQSDNKKIIADILKKFGANHDELDAFDMSWFAFYCCKLMELSRMDDQAGERYICESLQVVTVVLRMYPELVNKHCRVTVIQTTLSRLLKSSSAALIFDSLKLLEEVGKYFANQASLEGIDKQVEVLKEGVDFWEDVIPGPIVTILQSSDYSVKIKATTCDWLATIGSNLFAELTYRHQIVCKTLLLGLSQDLSDQIKAAAVRALGVIITFSCMKEDTAFIVDASNIMMGYISSSNATLQMKAAWAIGNLCDGCVKNSLLCDSDEGDHLPEDLVYQLLTSSIRVATDNDKVKSNGVRAIGNLIRCLPKDMLEKGRFQIAVAEGAKSVSDNVISGPMKGRWNACYACSNIFHNPDLNLEQATWKTDVLLALVSALKDCKNFKVRIGATSALRILKQRTSFGNESLFKSLWQTIVEALGTSDSMSDLREFRYKDTLQTQICDLLCHLVSIASITDLEDIQEMKEENYKLLAVHLYRYFGQTRHPLEMRNLQSEDTTQLISYNEKLHEWQAMKRNLQRVKLSTNMAGLIDSIDVLFS